MRILVSGSTGLIGRALCAKLEASGLHEIVRLVRPASKQVSPSAGDAGSTVRWEPASGWLDGAALRAAGPFDAVVNLAGESIASGRWSPERKERIRSSRTASTRLLVSSVAEIDESPQVFLSASAIGYYGDRGAEELSEDSGSGKGFLAEVCVAWEAEASLAAATGARVVMLRTGIVLSKDGGALAKQLPLFRIGLGGKLGSGHQYMSWITLRDEVAAIEHALTDPILSGAVNLVAPGPVTNAELTNALAKAVSRPAILKVPGFALAAVLGRDASSELLLASQKVKPARLVSAGFSFADPALPEALAALIF